MQRLVLKAAVISGLLFDPPANIWPKPLEGIGHKDPSTLWAEQWRWVDGPWKDGP
jgi:hypothetical protein